MNKETALITAKRQIKAYLTSQFPVKSTKTNFRCISGTHEDKNPSMGYDSIRWKVHCFSCKADYDIFDLYRIKNKLTPNSPEIFERVFNWLGIELDKPNNNNSFLKEKKNICNLLEESKSETDYKQLFTEANKNLSDLKCLEYLKKRGISQETANKYKLGYIEDWQSPKALKEKKNPPKTPRVIIPTSDYSYVTCDIRDNLTDQEKKYSKMKEGNINIFNFQGLKKKLPCFVVEGEFDALSFLECGYNAVALGSVSNVNIFLTKLSGLSIDNTLIVALDNDTHGKDASHQLVEGLKKLGVKFISLEIKEQSSGDNVYWSELYGNYKDANEFLVKDKEGFKSKAEEVLIEVENRINVETQAKIEEEKTKKSEYMDSNISNQISLFEGWVDSGKNKKVISTGFAEFDNYLDGGLYEGLYILGAISSLGKTTFVIQIADYLSSQGNDVLYISLEMSKYEIMAKSISRHTLLLFQEDKSTDQTEEEKNELRRLRKTTRGITVGSRYDGYSDIEQEAIKAAKENYKNESKNLWITEGLGDIGATKIREMVKTHQQFTDTSPVVIIDYLQILAPYEKLNEKQSIDKAVMELKRISRDFKIPVLVISSLNRMSYKDAVNMTAFKESGGIEYSADVLLGLQLKGVSEKNNDFDFDAAKSKNPREIELKILKNRNGTTGKTVNYEYYPEFNYFKEIKQDYLNFNNAADQGSYVKNKKVKNKNN